MVSQLFILNQALPIGEIGRGHSFAALHLHFDQFQRSGAAGDDEGFDAEDDTAPFRLRLA